MLLLPRRPVTLLSTTEQRSCELADEVAGAATTVSAAAAVALLSAAQ